MAPIRLNVLVYTGSGTTTESVKHAVYTLRRLLAPNYAVSTIDENALLKEPWGPTCAMVVFPGGADLKYCQVLNGSGNDSISTFVRRGGRYLGFCAGGYYGSGRCEFEVGSKEGMEVIGSRELAFFPGTCRGSAFKGFKYHSEAGARAVKLRINRSEFADQATAGLPDTFRSYYNGGGVFVDAEAMKSQNIHVLAEYAEDLDVDGGSGKAAIIHVQVKDGHVILTGPHPEFDQAQLNAPRPEVKGYDKLILDLEADEQARIAFLRAALMKTGLEVVQDPVGTVPSLSSLHLSSANHQEVGDVLYSLGNVLTEQSDGTELIKAEINSFRVVNPSSTKTWDMSSLSNAVNDSDPKPDKRETDINDQLIVFAHEDSWPQHKETPHFDHELYYSSLSRYRRKERDSRDWGTTLMYGEVVTSTNTMLEKNPTILGSIPTGFTFTATTQVSSRGRGSNVWIAPPGSLMFSVLINHPGHLMTTRPIVFIQYLAAVAIVEAIQGYDKGYEKMQVRLKWPNDIYCRDPTKPEGPPHYVKIGGILANCSYSSGNYQIVLGVGINTNNSRPTTSLRALAEAAGLPPLKLEQLLARILTRMEARYNGFTMKGFSGELEGAYYRHWLHSDQVVTLEMEGGVRAKIRGITKDWGMLVAEELGLGDRTTGRTFALQSDENSFDYWRGLVKRKI
ncbi:uncharacterized protein PgNI_08915 [Pyricularia grisea]|uniref:BPL/LPL catalytic domain-containing protein n=1 Tax=Pyricularia grisea TaxID=148305 RepID=A0A6P8AVN4_PYRGI|nr:uncharacterized protein PgNI_08915 [Pyricularia grisea]TLD06229.1 hypothetical protein PgNI_08915 [Pyricularia grisea]